MVLLAIARRPSNCNNAIGGVASLLRSSDRSLGVNLVRATRQGDLEPTQGTILLVKAQMVQLGTRWRHLSFSRSSFRVEL